MLERTDWLERAIRVVLIAGFLGVLAVEAWLLVQALVLAN